MGLFSFVTNAGGALGSKVFDMLNDDEDFTKPETISPERLNELRKKGISSTLNEQLDIEPESIGVAVNNDNVVLTGTVPTQEACEKAALIAGNQNGISTVDCQLIVENPEPEALFYTVKSGDSLSKIAKEHYQNAGKYMVIFEANKPMLTDPNKIYPGQVLRIPALSD